MKTPKLFVTCLLLFFSITSALSQEICDNGVDDDGDGFVDCFDSDCTLSSGNGINKASCAGAFIGKDVICQAKPTSFPKFDMKLKWQSPNKTTNHLNRASVGDLDRDGIPEVVVMEVENDYIYILNGLNGSIKKSLKVGYGLAREHAIGNIDNSSCGWIFTSDGSQYIYAYDCNLNLKWQSTKLSGDPYMFGLADFDNDGKAEIYSRDEVLAAESGIRIIKGTNTKNVVGAPVAVDILDGSGNVAGVGDNKLELILGCNIYAVNLAGRTLDAGSLTLRKNVANYFIRQSQSSTSVADYNQDGFLDVIASGSDGAQNANTTVFYWDVKNNVVKTFIDKNPASVFIAGCTKSSGTYYKNGWQNGTGRINIADIDGDGKLNASYISGKYLYALDENWNQKWRVTVNEETSGYTGCTVYDFNGDGAAEVVYRDEQFLYIINGSDGSVNTQQQCIARTSVEYPVVADIDGDGTTELCVTCGFDDALAWSNFCTLSYSENSCVRVFQSASVPWVPSRKLWNQHDYFVVNVNDDLTIPKVMQKQTSIFSTGVCTVSSNRPLNSFLNQSPYLDSKGCPTYASPDLTNVKTLFSIQQPTCPDTDFKVTIGVQNVGDVTATATIPITFYSGDPTLAGATKLNTVSINVNLVKGQTQTYPGLKVTGTGGPFKLYIVLNDAGTSVPTPIVLPNTPFLECNYDNVISADVIPKSVKITAAKISDNTKCFGATVPDNGAVQAYILVGGVQNTVDYNFYWSNGAVAKAIPADFAGSTYTGLAAGTYTVYARHKTALCSSDTTSISIVQAPKLPALAASIVVDQPSTSCGAPNGQMHATINNSDPLTNYTFTWYEGNDIFTSPQIGTGSVASNLKGGKTYTVLVTDNISGCQSVASLPVPDNTVVPQIAATAVDAICVPANSGSASANVGGVTAGYTFSWYNGAAVKPVADFTGASYTSLVTGSYTVVAKDNTSGCSSNPITVSVGVPAPFTVTPSMTAQQTSCNLATPNGAVTADVGGVTAGYTFNWFAGQNTLPANAVASPSALAAGIYTVKAINNATGCTATNEVTVTQNLIYPVVTLNPAPNSTCSTVLGSSTFTGSVSASVTYNGSGVVDFTPYQLVWHNGALATDPIIAGATGPTISQLNGGSYTLVVTRTDKSCAAAPVTAVVTNTTVLPTITTNQTPSTNCVAGKEDGVAEVTKVNNIAVGSTSNFNYQWFTGVGTGSIIAGATNTQLLNVQGGAAKNYTVEVTDKTSGCQNTATVLVADAKVIPMLSLSKVDNGICDPALVSPPSTYSGSVTATVTNMTGGLANYSFVFGGGAGAGVQGTSPNQNQYTQLNGSATAYTAQATQLSTGCVSAVTNIVVNNTLSLPVITTSATGSTNCVAGKEDGTASVTKVDGTAVASAVGYTYSWTGPAAPAFPVTNGVNNSSTASLIKLQGGAGYDYTVTVLHQTNGCQNTAVVNVPDSKVIPLLSLSKVDNGICDPALVSPPSTYSGSVTATVTNMTGGLANYSFVFSGGAGAGVQGTSPNQNQYTQLNGSATAYTAQATQLSTGCVSAASNIVVNNTLSLPVITTSATGSTNCVAGKEDGTASVTKVDGTAVASAVGYTYSWTGPAAPAFPVTNGVNNSNTASLIKLQGGAGYDYTVTVLHQTNGCQNTAVVNVPDSKVIPLLSLSKVDNGICDPALVSPPSTYSGSVTATVTNMTGGLANYSFVFSGGAGAGVQGTSPNQNQYTQLNGSATAYTAQATQLSTGCVSAVTNIVVNNTLSLPVITTSATGSTNCLGGTKDGVAKVLDVVPNGRNYTYKWFDGNSTSGTPGPTTVNTTSTTNNYSGVQGGLNGASLIEYTVEVTILQTGCVNTATVGVPDNKSVPILGPLKETDNTNCTGTPNGTASVNTALPTAVVYKGVNQVSPYAGFDFAWTGPLGFTGSGTSISSLAAGSYSLTATNTASNCTSNPVTITVNDNLFIPVIKVVEVDQTSCDTSAPNGSLTATVDETSIGGSTGVTAGYTFTWLNTVTSATTVASAITNQKGNQDYKITVVRGSTGCTNSQTDYLKEKLTIPTVTTVVTDMTTCSPYNGRIDATPSPGAVAAYDFFWYDGSNAADENVVITNGNAGLFGTVLTNTYSKLIPGDYAVVARDKTTKCASSQLISTVNDKTPAINPEAENTKIPAFCNTAGGELTGAVRLTPTIVTFTADAVTDQLTLSSPITGLAVGQTVLISRDGSNVLPGGLISDQTYIITSVVGLVIKLKDILNNPIDITSNGVDGVISDFVTTTGAGGYTFNWYNSVPSGMNPTLPINYYTNPPNFAALSSSPANPNSVYNGIKDGLYTLEVTDNTTGCKNFISHTLPFQGSHAVIRITKSNSTFCSPNPDNGSITIRIEDPTTGGPFVPDNYTVTLKQGVTTVAGPFNPVDPFNVSGSDFLVSNTLAPGTFIVTVQQNYGALCALDQDVIIGRDALPPVVDLASALVPNNACDNTKYNGQIPIRVSKDPADLVSTPITYDFTLAPDPNGFSSSGNAAGTYTAAGLDPRPYTFTATASTGCVTTKNFKVLDAPVKTQLTAADVTAKDAAYCTRLLEQSAEVYVNQLNLIGGGVENLNDYRFDWVDNSTSTTVLSANGDATANNGAGGDELINGVTAAAGTVWKGSYMVTATKVTDTKGSGGIGCASSPFTVTIPLKTINPQITLTPTGNTSCDPTVFDGTIKVDVTTASGPGNGGTYGYAWTPNGGLGQPTNSASGNSGIGNMFSGLADGNYSVVATNDVTGCSGTLSTTVVRDTPPVFTLSASVTNETNCGSFDGKIDNLQVFVNGAGGTVSDFDYVWFRSDLLPASKVLDGQDVLILVDDQLTAATYPAIALDKYFVKAIRKAGGAGIGCESTPLRKDILDDRVYPQVSLSSIQNTACDGVFDGQIVATANTTGFGVGTQYDFAWTVPVAPAGSNITPQGMIAANASGNAVFTTAMATDRIGDGTYSVVVTNQSNSCQATGSVGVNYQTIPMSVSASATDVTLCAPMAPDGSGTITGITEVPGPGNTANYTYTWATDAAMTLQFGVVNDPLLVRSGLAAGTYFVTAKRNMVSPPVTPGVNGSGCITAPTSINVFDKHVDPTLLFTSIQNTACDGVFDGQIVATANTTGFGVGTQYDFAWTVPVAPAGSNITPQGMIAANASGNAVFTTAMATDRIGHGTYSVVVTNQSNSCQATGSVGVNYQTIPMSVSASATDVTLCAPMAPDGSGTITGITEVPGPGNTANYTYTWATDAAMTLQFGAVNDPLLVRSGLAAGTYFVTAKRNTVSPPVIPGVNGSGCVTAPTSINVLDKHVDPTLLFTSIQNTACDGVFDGQIVATANTTGFGVGTQYDFAWTVPVAPAGSNITPQGMIAANASGNAVFTTAMATDRIGDGTYSVVVTNQSNSCQATGSVGVNYQTIPMSVSASATDVTLCAPMAPDGSGTITGITEVPGPGNTANYTYTWATDAAMTLQFGAVNDPLLVRSGLAAGTYFVTAKRNTVSPPVIPGVNGSGCVTAPTSINVLDKHVDPTIAPETLNPDINCAGSAAGTGQITIQEASPMNFTYSWFAGDDVTGAPVLTTGGVNGEVLNSLKQGDYTVQVRDNATMCTSVKSYAIENDPTIVSITVTPVDVTQCNLATGVPLNGSGTITTILEDNSPTAIPGNYSFIWTDVSNAVLQSSNVPTLNNLAPGTYFVNALNSSSNCSANYSFNVNDKTIGTTTVTLIDFGNVERCVNPKAGFLTAQGGGNGASYSYEWYPGDQRPSPAGAPIAATSLLNGITMPIGQSQITFTVKAINNTNNCWAVDAYTVPLIMNPIFITASSSPLTYCGSNNGEVFAAIINDSKSDYNFYWGIGNSVNPASPDYTTDDVPNLSDGNYTVVAIDILDNTCISPTVTVTIDKQQTTPPVATTLLKSQTFCDLTKPNGEASASVGGDVQHYTFEWYQGTTVSGPVIYTGSEISGLSNTDYTVNATDLVTGCAGTATINIPNEPERIPDPTIVVLSEQTSCLTWSDGRPRYNGSLSVSVAGVTKDYIFDWANGGTKPPPIDFTGEIYDSLAAGNYTVVATSKISGCKSNPVTAPIIEDKKFPTIDFLIQSATCNSANGFITLLVSNDISLAKVTWYHNGAQVDDGPNLQDAMAGLYTVKVVTTLGCETDKDVEIPTDILAYNGISRNADGNNDFFLIECIDKFENNHVEIFNRAGTKVYEADYYDNIETRFEGYSNRGVSLMGTHLPSGTYFYVISKGDGSKSIVGYLELVD